MPNVVKPTALILCILLCSICLPAICALAERPSRSGFTLWQLPEQTHSQMMSYVVRTVGGRVIVIDGGMPGDADYLRAFLAECGNRVDIWFVTHLHDDHFGALGEILQKPSGLRIGRIYASTLDDEWVRQYGGEGEFSSWIDFQQALRSVGRRLIQLRPGGRMDVDGAVVEVLGVANPEIRVNGINNSSIVLRVSDSSKSVLFLGDLGPEGGRKLLESKYRDRLDCDYVQMAHHGQNGVNFDVYQAASPQYCLWPTPSWLWDNNIGGQGKGTGPWRTLEVRAWMDQLGVKNHYVTADGLKRID